MEVVGEPARWIIKANWKYAADNFASDSYHTVMTHYSGVELGQLPPNPMFASFGVQIAMENGHGIGVIGAPPNIPLPEYLALPQEIVEAAHAKLTEPDNWKQLRRSNFVPGNVFPNFSLLNVMQLPGLEENEYPIPFMSMRVWQPKGPNEIELLSWFLELKKKLLKSLEMQAETIIFVILVQVECLKRMMLLSMEWYCQGYKRGNSEKTVKTPLYYGIGCRT